jgi:hypothetical protein
MRRPSRHLVDVLRVVERARAFHAERRPTSFETIDRWIARQDRRFMSRPEAMRKVDGRSLTIRRIDDRNVPGMDPRGIAAITLIWLSAKLPASPNIPSEILTVYLRWSKYVPSYGDGFHPPTSAAQ